MSISPDFLRCHSDENLRYFGVESEMEALTNSMNAVSITTSVSCKALENYAQGKKVDKHLVQITELLKNPSDKNFSHLSVRDIQANILLILCRYSHEQKPEDLILLSLMLPYYISILAKNEDEFCCGIISEDLVLCLDNPESQLLHDLDFRVNNFLKRNSFYQYSKAFELEYFAKLLKKMVPSSQSEIKEAFVLSLQNWVRAVSPEPTESSSVIKRVSELTCYLSTKKQSPVTTYLSYIDQLDQYNHHTDQFFKELYVWQIGESKAGNDISIYAGFLESMLTGQERYRYADLTVHHKLINVWLLIKAWEQTNDSRYKDILVLALAHVASYLHALVPMPTSDQLLASTIQKDIAKSTTFAEFLVAADIQLDLQAATEALSYFTNTVKAPADEVAAAVKLFGFVLAHPFEVNADYVKKTTLELLESYASREKLNVDIAFYVLHELSCNAENTSVVQWVKNLNDERVINTFVHLVNSPNISKYTHNFLFKHLLAAKANLPDSSVELAIRLLPSITAMHVPALLNMVQARGQGSAILDLFTRQVALVSKDVQVTIMKALQHRRPFVAMFEKALRKDPTHPGMDFLIAFVNSAQAAVEQRGELFTAFCHHKAPSHYLGFAPRVLHSDEVAELHKFTDMLIERMKENLDSPAMVTFLGCINTDKVDFLVRNKMCAYLLQKNTPESIFLLSKMSPVLSLSALWTLLKRIDALNPQNAVAHHYRRLALKNVISAGWYGDYYERRSSDQRQFLLKMILHFKAAGKVFRPTKNWFEERNIILYSENDQYARRIPDRVSFLMKKCGLTGNKLQKLAHNKIAKMVEAQIASKSEGKRKHPSTYKNFLYTIAASRHNKRLEQEALKNAAIALEETMSNTEVPDAAIERTNSPGPESE